MTTAARSGSAIIYCLGLSAIVVMIGFGFLRATMRDTTAGSSSQHMLLAQAAARAGVDAATEAIIADYASTTLIVGLGNGGTTTVTNPPTFLDGPYRAPFVSLSNPDKVQDVDDNKQDGMNDVRSENTVINPMTKLWSNDAYAAVFQRWEWHTAGIVNYDGRGRFIEPGYHHTARPSPGGASPTAVATTKFLDATATPSRHAGLFLDSSMRRITSDGSPSEDQAARAAARYRLRYAVGVIDLGGHLLSTPLADLNADWQTSGNDYRIMRNGTAIPAKTDATYTRFLQEAWLQEAAEAWYNMVTVFPTYRQQSTHHTQALRWQHVFQGRGNTSNYDRSPVGGFPVTFPLMFRIQQDTSVTGVNYYWGLYAKKLSEYSGNDQTAGLLNIPGTTATAAGGQLLKRSWSGDYYTHTHVGPQPSWYTQHQSLQGMLATYSSADYPANPRRDGAYYYSETAPNMETALFLPTPFGRGVSAYPYVSPYNVQNHPPAPAPARKWYESACSTPWYVNLLTAPPRVINAMLKAYLPPSYKQKALVYENFALKVPAADLLPPKSYTTTREPQESEYLGNWTIISTTGSALKSHDLFTRIAGLSFSEWPAPTSGGIDPQFLGTDSRTPLEIYPGTLWQGTNSQGLTLDDLGRHISTDTAVNGGFCSHLGISFNAAGGVTKSSGTLVYLKGGGTAPTSTPPAGWGSDPNDRFVRRSPSGESYWCDIERAFTSSVAFARAVWVQYPRTGMTITPVSAFNPASLRDPDDVDSIAEIDQLFLRQLGENYVTPGDGTPLRPIVPGTSSAAQTFAESTTAITHTIKTLSATDLLDTTITDTTVTPNVPLAITTKERCMVMERVLNDFRMSFFGASPQYCDRFRPLDFDGDGKVMCSGYDSMHPSDAFDPASRPDPSNADVKKGIDRWKAVDATFTDPVYRTSPLVASGRGPVPDHWFSLAGTFYIGKSHHYRIICRGELFDNVSQRPVSDATLESVFVVDPEGTDLTQSHFLFQRWHFNRYTGHLSTIER